MHKWTNISLLNSTLRGSIYAGLMLSAPTATAANYTVIAGSPVQVNSVSGPIPGPSGNNIGYGDQSHYIRPFLGGLVMPNSTELLGCTRPDKIVVIDGKKGVEVHDSGIIAGLTGVISGAVTVLQDEDNPENKVTFTGGIIFDANGFASPVGDTTPEAAEVLCAGGTVPFPNYLIRTAGNTAFGNRLGEFTGHLWLYVPRTVSPGQYNMEEIGISQGASYNQKWNGYLAITNAGDTITVLPPPCTIATETTINFDTTMPGGRIVAAPITYQCGEVEATTVLDAYLIANAVSDTFSATELKLTSAGGTQPGGVVRGYIGEGVNTDSANCADTTHSLSMDGAFNTRLAPVSNGLALQIPLVWQLCRRGDERPGVATGSVLLDIGYK